MSIMKHADEVRFDSILANLKASNSKQILKLIAAEAARALKIDEKKIISTLTGREKLSASGIGEGVALPNMQLPFLRSTFTVLAKLTAPVDFHAGDGRAVDLVCLLISPEKDGPLHLRNLSRLSRLLLDPQFSNRIRKGESEDAIRALIIDTNNRMAA